MRHEKHITTLLDLINSKTLDDIKREIQICARMPKTDASEDQLLLLRTAEKFKQTHHDLPADWVTSKQCYKDLHLFFSEDSSIKDHEYKAICAWYLLLAHSFFPDFPLESIISLGAVYIESPTKFTAFIAQLLANNVSPYSIAKKKLLRQCFEYYSCDLETLQHIYTLIKNCAHFTDNFLTFLEKECCLSRGFINTIQNGKYYSHNVMGTLFQHDNPIELPNIFSLQEMSSSAWTTHCELLFDLFGIEFLKFVSENDIFAFTNIFNTLSDSMHSPTILKALPNMIMSGALSKTTHHDIFLILSRKYIYPDNTYDPTLISLMEQHPFFIHIYGCLEALPLPFVENAFKTLLSDAYCMNRAHIELLIIFQPRLLTFPLLNELLVSTLFEYFITTRDIDNDNDPIHRISYAFKSLCEKKREECEKIFHAGWQLFLENQDYPLFETTWNQQLRVLKIVNYLNPNPLRSFKYPQNIYEFYYFILQHSFNLSQNSSAPFAIKMLLDQMHPEMEFQVRILREAICFSEENAPLMEALINFAKTLPIDLNDFFHAPFGYHKFVIDAVFMMIVNLSEYAPARGHYSMLPNPTEPPATKLPINLPELKEKLFAIVPNFCKNHLTEAIIRAHTRRDYKLAVFSALQEGLALDHPSAPADSPGLFGRKRGRGTASDAGEFSSSPAATELADDAEDLSPGYSGSSPDPEASAAFSPA